MVKSIFDLMDGTPDKPSKRRLYARLYLGTVDDFIDIWDWEECRGTIAPKLTAKGWNQNPRWRERAIPAVPPEQPPDEPVGYSLLGIVEEVPWPKKRPKKVISAFQKPRPEAKDAGPKDADTQIRRLLDDYFDNNGYSRFGQKEYRELYDTIAPLVPGYGLFKKQLYKEIGYSSDISDNFTRTSFTIVRSDFKDALESLEPDRHFFFPYEIRCDDGRTINDYWIFLPTGKVEAVDPYASCFIEKFSDVGSDHFVDYVPWTETEAARNRVVVRKSVLDGRHYVVDEHFGAGRPIISSDLAKALETVLWKNQKPVPLIAN